MLENLLQDARHGLRLLLLNPGFALVAILSLALCIGANTAIFQLLDAVRLRSLPVQHPEQPAIVKIGNFESASGSFSSRYPQITNPQWEQIRAQQKGFSGIFAWSPEQLNLARGGEVRQANVLWVSGDFFDVLGVKPQAGRLLNASDDRRGCSGAAVVTDSFWRSEYGASSAVFQKRVLSRVLVTMISTQSETMFLELSTDYRVLGFTATLAVLTCILFGLAPALRATKSSPASAMRAARTASSMLFGLKPYDPATLAFAIVTLAFVAIAASYIPARRAAGVDPMVALREE